MIEIVCWVLVFCGAIAGGTAQSRGHNVFFWFAVGFALGPIGVVLSSGLRSKSPVAVTNTSDDPLEAAKQQGTSGAPDLIVLPVALVVVLRLYLAIVLGTPIVLGLGVFLGRSSLSSVDCALGFVIICLMGYLELRVLPIWHAFPRALLGIAVIVAVAFSTAAAVLAKQAPSLDGLTIAATAVALAGSALCWLVARSPADLVRVQNPIPGERWLAFHAGASPFTNNHHRAYRQRYAIDANVMRRGTRARAILPDNLQEYYSFGVPVCSPIDGTVTELEADLPDLPPCFRDSSRPKGNFVAVSASGTTFYLAHLQRGSLSVRVGDAIVAGQTIGRIGNSGNTSEPHLHIHAESSDGDPVPFAVSGRWLLRGSMFASNS
ncbi:MAG: M23 family metallopeptidase [Candidatus Velthaea sp.]